MSTHVTYRPSELDAKKLHGCLLGGIAPRPIAFVSTVDGQGRVNLAPFSYFNVFSANPPMVIFSLHDGAEMPRPNTPGTTCKKWGRWW